MSNTSISHKELIRRIKTADLFLKTAAKITKWAEKNIRMILAFTAMAFILGLAIVFYSHHQTQRDQESADAFYNAKTKINSLAKASDSDWESKSTVALEELKKIPQKFGTSSGGFEALMLLGDLYTDHKNSGTAEGYYAQAVKTAPTRSLKAIALNAYAYSLEDQKKNTQAIEQLKAALSVQEPTVKIDVLFSLARNYLAMGDKSKAIDHLELINKDYPNSAAAKAAQTQIQTLKNL